MSIELKEISIRENYLHCHFEGDHSGKLPNLIEYTKRIQRERKESNCQNSLLDFSSISGKIGIIAEHLLGEHIARVIPSKTTKVAVLAPQHMKDTASGHLEN
ncbi:MAG: hypothetical protein ABIJ37_09245 [Pseudomonadota bacterium]